MKKNYLLILLCFFSFSAITAQNSIKKIDKSILQKTLNNQLENEYSSSDLSNWEIQSDASSLEKNSWYYYLVQTHNSIEVRNALANLSVNSGVANLNNIQFVKNLNTKVNSSSPSISAKKAVMNALSHIQINNTSVELLENNTINEFVFNKTSDLNSDINVKLVYEVLANGNVNLAWNVNLDLKNGQHWWNIRIDANTGSYINKNDWVTSCSWGGDHNDHSHDLEANHSIDFLKQTTSSSILIGGYKVLPYYVESPNHGDFEFITNPDDATASPFGWHDENGVAGSETTNTSGNNVDSKDASGDGGVFGGNDSGQPTDQSSAGLNFDFPYGGPGVAAITYMDAATTNLFYMSNVVHDVYYKYGFDEASGNFQLNNYGNGGNGNDRVKADAQDGSGTDNANFSTPTDGSSGRMQMFLWTGGAYNPNPTFEVNNTVLAGVYPARDNSFDAPGHIDVVTPLTRDLVLYLDGVAPDVTDACTAATNAAALNGKIAVIRRGDCAFTQKVSNADAAGADGVLIINNVPGDIGMAGTTFLAQISIPAYSLNQADGEAIIARMAIETVNATLHPIPTFVELDGDFDNGVIAHEYGHGINIRLVGGRFNSGCVGATESMGEGWGDFIGKILLLKDVSNGIAVSGTGTFVVGQAPSGQGIRPAPYSGSIANNPMTYETLLADTGNATYTIPHGVGSVWAGMLWDLTWDLIAIHGFNPDIYDTAGTEGNIVALKLIVEAMKVTACNPGFVNGRDAILAADQTLFAGANNCAIWGAFARRGLGENANQGSTNSTSDGSFDYTNPAACAADYLLTIGGPTEACVGASLDFDMVFNAQNGFNTSTGFTVAGLPGGSTPTFSPTTISDTGLVTLNITGLPVGNHTVTVTPGGDTSKNLVLNLVINATNPILSDGDTQFSANGSAYTTFNDGTTINVGPGINLDLNLPTTFDGTLLWTSPNGTTYTTDTVSFLAIVDGNTAIEGVWTVEGLFNNECSTNSETVTFTVNIDATLNVSTVNFENLSIYPNPTNGNITISSSTNLSNSTIVIHDVMGRVLMTNLNKTVVNNNQINIDLNVLASGSYFITIEDDTYKSTKQIIKK